MRLSKEDHRAPLLFHEKALQHEGHAGLLVCSRRENGSGVCLDLQVIDNVPGSKVVEDVETHHILTGNLYKPRKRVSSTNAASLREILEILEEGS